VNVPVHFSRIIDNIKNQVHGGKNGLVDVTPLECFEMIEKCKRQIHNIGGTKVNSLFDILFDYYLSPKDLLMKHRFNRKTLEILLQTIIINYKKALSIPW